MTRKHILILCIIWTKYFIGVFSYRSNPDSTFQVITGHNLTSQLSTRHSGKTLLGCMTICILDTKCSALNMYSNNYNGELNSMVDCYLINIKDSNGISLALDTEVSSFVESSYFHLNVTAKAYLNVTSSSFVVKENISIPHGQNQEYCFLYCNLLGNDCQGLQAEKSCTTNKFVSCQIFGSPLPSSANFQPNYSFDIYLLSMENGKYPKYHNLKGKDFASVGMVKYKLHSVTICNTWFNIVPYMFMNTI